MAGGHWSGAGNHAAKSGRLTLEQISEMVGYASLKTFRRAFQKETGFTPAGYRESVLV
jgi:AraC-like DNA-binding protein